MNLKIKAIHLIGVSGDQDSINYADTNTDVIVYLENGEKYLASFYAYENINTMKLLHKDTGAYNGGQYFWMPNMVLIDHCCRDNIESVVEDLLDEGDFLMVFKKIT